MKLFKIKTSKTFNSEFNHIAFNYSLLVHHMINPWKFIG